MDQKAWGLWMLGAEVATAYRLNAAHCVEMAKEFSKAEERLAFLQMAQVWLRLADIAEKFDDIK
jgi:hypothetical protein